MRSRLVVLLVLAAALSLVAPAAALAAPAATKVTFNEKFTFTGQTFITTITDGVIRAGSKKTGNGSTFTNCDYFTAQDAFLGGFQSADFASNSPDEVQSFCLLHFADRAV